MTEKVEKVIVLGIDAPIVPRLRKWAQDGTLPTLGKLMREGVFAQNCLVPLPTITPPNWTTIATGAWCGTHGVTDFEGHVPGTPLDSTYQNFDARLVKAEPLWKAAERGGKKSIIINYPASWMTDLKEGIILGGFGNFMNDWRFGISRATTFSLNNLSSDILLSIEPYPYATEVSFHKAEGWEGVEHSAKALETTATLALRRTRHNLAPITWHVLVDDSEGKGYDTVVVAKAKNKAGVYARLRTGEWSKNIYESFQTDDGAKKAAFRMKVVELSPDARNFRLFVPGLCSLNEWSTNPAVEDEAQERERHSARPFPLGIVAVGVDRHGYAG